MKSWKAGSNRLFWASVRLETIGNLIPAGAKLTDIVGNHGLGGEMKLLEGEMKSYIYKYKFHPT